MDKKLLTKYAVFLEDPDNPDYDGTRLTEEEIKEIERHLNNSDDTRRELQVVRAELRTLINTFEKEGFAGISTHPVLQKSQIKSRSLTYLQGLGARKAIFAIAAAVVFTFTSLFYLTDRTQPNITLYDNYFDIYPNLIPLSRGDESNLQLQHAMVEYEQGNYSKTLKILRVILDAEPNNIPAHFYSGIVNLVKGHPEPAIVHFQKTIAGENRRFLRPAQWYLGLAYMKNGAIPSAKHSFELIVSKNVEYKQQSQEILNSLDQFSSVKSP